MNRASRSSSQNRQQSQWNYVPWVILVFLTISNVWLMSMNINQSMAGDAHYSMSQIGGTIEHNTNNYDTNKDNRYEKEEEENNYIKSFPNSQNIHNYNQNEEEEEDPDNPCHFKSSFNNLIYVYDLPYELRDDSRKKWYEMFYRRKDYDDKKSLNYGFGDVMEISLFGSDDDNSNEEYYYTHMHSLEIIFNERLTRQENRYVTKDPSKATLFWIPYPFALDYRYWHGRSWDTILENHEKLQNWLDVCE